MESASLQTFCTVLSLSVVTLCLVMKVPQILSIVRSGDTKGISLGSVLLEECGYSIMLAYNFAMGYPAASYLEYPFLVVQDLLVLGLIFHTRDMISLKMLAGFIVYMVVYLSVGYRMVPDFILTASISLCTPLGISSKSAQILDLYKRKDPGRLSLATWAIAGYGCIARVITSAVQTGDAFMVLNFSSSAILNCTICAMIVYYRQLHKKKLY